MKNNAPVTLCLVIGALALSPIASLRGATAAEPETLTAEQLKAEGAKFKGTLVRGTIEEESAPKHPLFREYGMRTFDTFKKHREIVAALKKLDPKFDPHAMGTSNLSAVVTVDGHTYLFLEGCYPHNCGGTQEVVAFEPASKAAYLLRPTEVGPDSNPSGKFYLYGKPATPLRAAMCSAYPD